MVSYNVPTNLAVTLMSATPYLKSNRYSPPVSLNLPIFDAPAWLPALVSCGALACLGSFNNWGAGTNVAFVRSVTADKFPIPLIGFGCATSFSANYGASVSSDGKATLSGGGSASFSIDSNFIPLLSGASVGITVSSDFAFAQGANGFYTTQLSALHAIISGSLSLKTPLSFKTPEVSVASYTLSAQISVPISIGISMDLVFGLNERGRLLGQDIPFSFQSINGGSLSLGASVSGKVALIVTSASVGGAVYANSKSTHSAY